MNPSIVARTVKLKGDLTVDTLLGGRAGGEPTIHFVTSVAHSGGRGYEGTLLVGVATDTVHFGAGLSM